MLLVFDACQQLYASAQEEQSEELRIRLRELQSIRDDTTLERELQSLRQQLDEAKVESHPVPVITKNVVTYGYPDTRGER